MIGLPHDRQLRMAAEVKSPSRHRASDRRPLIFDEIRWQFDALCRRQSSHTAAILPWYRAIFPLLDAVERNAAGEERFIADLLQHFPVVFVCHVFDYAIGERLLQDVFDAVSQFC